jgi:transcription termination factor Rho
MEPEEYEGMVNIRRSISQLDEVTAMSQFLSMIEDGL